MVHSDQRASLALSQRNLLYSMALVGLLFVLKLVGGYLSNSLALLSDSLHLITDFIALFISWLGLKLSSKPANHRFTFGHYRHGIFTAFINNFLLVVISFYILYQAYARALNPLPVDSASMLFFSVLGLITNSLIFCLLRNHKDNLNVKSALLHFIGDALSDGFVLVGGLIIYFTNWFSIDTYLSVFLALLILKNALKMMAQCIRIFLEATPPHLSIESLTTRLESIDKVITVRDLHVWSLSEEVLSMTAHISTSEKSIAHSEILIHTIQHILSDEYGITHSTLQIEQAPCSSCYHHKQDHPHPCPLCIDCTYGNYHSNRV